MSHKNCGGRKRHKFNPDKMKKDFFLIGERTKISNLHREHQTKAAQLPNLSGRLILITTENCAFQ